MEDGSVARTPDGKILDPELREEVLQTTFKETTVILAIKHFQDEKELWDERERLAKEKRVYESRIQLLFLDTNRKPGFPLKKD
ncbi:hypothetical protein [Peribacillus glennii]|uniref:hypothetical protein n=1 Tax=Peribacillus glennii TaxID=2303991 RepID=UPI00115D4A6D|nr:hypothetical protein [Peribacillus glennii]